MDIGIDLGTSTIIIYVKGKGIVFQEPSVIAYNVYSNKIVAFGERAYDMIGKVPHAIKVVRPILDGVIADYDFAEKLISEILKKVCNCRIFKPRITICVPSIVTAVEKNAIVDAAVNIGARKVYVIDEPIAAAIGAGINISEPKGRLIVDIGGGTTDIAVLSLNGIVNKNSIKVAGDKFDESVIKTIKNKFNLDIGYNTARKVKENIGRLIIEKKEDILCMEVKGKSLITGLPFKIKIDSSIFLESFNILAYEIICAIKLVIEQTPPDLLGDIQSRCLLLTGGGCKLKDFDKLVKKETNLKSIVVDNALECVAIGTGKAFEHIHEIDEGLIEESGYKR